MAEEVTAYDDVPEIAAAAAGAPAANAAGSIAPRQQSSEVPLRQHYDASKVRILRACSPPSHTKLTDVTEQKMIMSLWCSLAESDQSSGGPGLVSTPDEFCW